MMRVCHSQSHHNKSGANRAYRWCLSCELKFLEWCLNCVSVVLNARNNHYRESKGEDGKAILGESPIVNSKAFLEQDILSIIIFKSGMIWESSLPDIEVLTYNYSLKENRFLSNEELFDILNLDMDDIEKKLSNELTENYIKDTVLDGEKISEYNPDYTECIYYDITNESKIYLDKGIHFIIRGYSGINKKNYDIKI